MGTLSPDLVTMSQNSAEHNRAPETPAGRVARANGMWCHYNGKRVKRHQNSLHGASHSRLALEDAAKLDAERAPAVKAWEQSLHEKGFWRAPEAIPESLDAKIDGNAPAGQQLDALEGWLDRQKDHDAGDWPEAGAFAGGKHDRHASADDFQA